MSDLERIRRQINGVFQNESGQMLESLGQGKAIYFKIGFARIHDGRLSLSILYRPDPDITHEDRGMTAEKLSELREKLKP